MTPTEKRAELLAAVDAARRSRDAHRAAAQADDETVLFLERVLDATAATTPVLRVPERPQWLPIGRAAQMLGVEKKTLAQRCRRGGVRAGIARKVGGGWQIRLGLMAPNSARLTR